MSELSPSATATAPQPSIEPKKEANAPLTEVRRVALTSAVALLMMPVSIGLTHLVTNWFKAPKAHIEEITDTAIREDVAPERTRFAKSTLVVALIADKLGGFTNTAECVEWLAGTGTWSAHCGPVLRTSVIQARAQAEGTGAFFTNFLSGQAPGKKRATKTQVPALFADMDAAAAELGALVPLMDEVLAATGPLTGDTIFRVGVMNLGDSDGTLADEARLTFTDANGSASFRVLAQERVLVRSRTYAEIMFGTARGFVHGEEPIRERFRAAVRTGARVPYDLSLSLSDSSDSIHSTIDP